MLFKEINKRDFDKLAPKMFSILSSNMEIINHKETILDDDCSQVDFYLWFKICYYIKLTHILTTAVRLIY